MVFAGNQRRAAVDRGIAGAAIGSAQKSGGAKIPTNGIRAEVRKKSPHGEMGRGRPRARRQRPCYAGVVMRFHMKAIRAVVILVLALALSSPVLAADFEAGRAAYNRGD